MNRDWAFTVNRELCLIFFVNRELTSPYFLCDSWIEFYFLREPWIGILYFPCDSIVIDLFSAWTVNFAYYLREFSNFSPKKFHVSFIVRERPFDFQGGGGFEKNILALIFVKKKYSSLHPNKKNSLTLGMRQKITALLRANKNQLSIWWKKILPS